MCTHLVSLTSAVELQGNQFAVFRKENKNYLIVNKDFKGQHDSKRIIEYISPNWLNQLYGEGSIALTQSLPLFFYAVLRLVKERSEIPDLDGSVLGAGGEQVSVRGERECPHWALVTREAVEDVPGVDVPHLSQRKSNRGLNEFK